MPTIDRRKLLGATAAAGSMLLTSMKAHAKFAGDVQLRGQIDRLERLPTRDLESLEDFRTSLRDFINTDFQRAATRRARQIFEEAGLNPRDEVSMEEAISMLESDPIIMNQTHAWITNQLAMWRDLQDAFHGDADRYLSEMAAADKAGPGSLELNPDMYIPPYTAWEIHNQPGGYVGDPFAGHMYHYGTNNLWIHNNDQDGMHADIANSAPVPDDGRVSRCLDLGCSVGQSAMGLKERFPEAEVWGIDVGAPMVRYAHMRAVDLGIDVNFAQRLAEDTKFPDNHFDMVTAFILFHEVTIEAANEIIREVHRVLRPGGKFLAIDGSFLVRKPRNTAYARWRVWWTDQWNTEVHYIPYAEYDFSNAFKAAGLNVSSTKGPKYAGSQNYIVGVKPV
ncbi:MAG: class I SAM-dependent methyltransferase [Rhodospirillaceae bacterium]